MSGEAVPGTETELPSLEVLLACYTRSRSITIQQAPRREVAFKYSSECYLNNGTTTQATGFNSTHYSHHHKHDQHKMKSLSHPTLEIHLSMAELTGVFEEVYRQLGMKRATDSGFCYFQPQQRGKLEVNGISVVTPLAISETYTSHCAEHSDITTFTAEMVDIVVPLSFETLCVYGNDICPDGSHFTRFHPLE